MKRISLIWAIYLLTACAATQLPASESPGLTFVHLNDTYRVGAVEGGNVGGFGRVVTVIKELQAEGKDVRILHGGDFLYPSLESQLWNGMQMVDAFNFMDAIAPMAVVIGNHELDRGTPEHLINAVKGSDFEWLGDNYTFETGDPAVDEALQSAYIIDHGDKSIGVFSLTAHADDSGNDRFYAPIDKDYLRIADRAIQHFEDAGVDAIVGLTHLYIKHDLQIAALREKHPKFVFIVGGHDHEPEFSAFSERSAAVMKGASNARVIWTIDLLFDVDGRPTINASKIVLDASIDPDVGYLQLENKWRGRLLEKFPFLEARVGTAALPLNAREEVIRSQESNWGNFIADQMRGGFGQPEADLAFINGGTLRIDDVIDGDILFEDIGRTFGFSSFLRYTRISGAEFKQVMEAGYRGTGTQGYFPQFSGFRVCVDRSRNDGDRIVSLQVPIDNGWQEIAADKTYSLVVPDFLFGGGDGYEIPKDRPVSPPASELVYLVLDAILDAEARGELIGAAVDPDNRRYHELLEGKQPCFE